MPNIYLPPTICIPSALEISSISNSNPMVITAIADSDQMNTYIPGQLIKLFVPVVYGMIQANNRTAQIIAVNGTSISVAIDSTQFDTFIMPAPNTEQPASLAPSGSRNLPYSNSTNLIAFQSSSNTGN